MFKIISPNELSIVLQSLMDVADNNEVHGGDKTRILLTFSMSKKSTRANYPTFDTRKTFNNLQYAFI